MTGREYWRRRLAPYAERGYRHGVLDRFEVLLLDENGNEVHLERPSAGGTWLEAARFDALRFADLAAAKQERETVETNARLVLTDETADLLAALQAVGAR